MSNVFGYPQRPEIPELELDDDMATMLVTALALSSTQLAHTGRQQELALYFCTRDVTVLGAGMIGFDVGEIPWDPGSFPQEQQFVTQAVDWALRRLGWERLGYYPPEDRLKPALLFVRRLVELLVPGHIEPPDPTFSSMRSEPLETCTVHQVFRHAQGCLLCNNARPRSAGAGA